MNRMDYIKLKPWEQARLEHVRRRRFWKKLFWETVVWFVAFLALFGVMYFLGGV